MLLTQQVMQARAAMSDTERSIFDRLIAIAEQVEPELQNSFRWRASTFTLHDNWHHWLFSIAATKSGVTLTFHKGWLLDDPKRVLQGDGKHLRLLRFRSIDAVDESALAHLLREAIEHQTDL